MQVTRDESTVQFADSLFALLTSRLTCGCLNINSASKSLNFPWPVWGTSLSSSTVLPPRVPVSPTLFVLFTNSLGTSLNILLAAFWTLLPRLPIVDLRLRSSGCMRWLNMQSQGRPYQQNLIPERVAAGGLPSITKGREESLTGTQQYAPCRGQCTGVQSAIMT